MASTDRSDGSKISAYDALLSVATARPNGLALRYKYRGDWLNWQWHTIVRSVDALAKAFAELGISAGDRIALVGEMTPSLLLTGLASDSVGAETFLVPPGTKAADILAVTADQPPRLVVIQGRDSLDTWLQMRPQLGSSQIVFDHAAPGRRHDSSVIYFNDLLAEATSRHSASARPRITDTDHSDRAVLWVEASTAWSGALAAVFDHWLGTGQTLALPEMLAAAARDRAEARPASWLASGASLATAAQDLAGRLPRRLTETNKGEPHSFISGLLRHQARKRLGLGNLSAIDAETPASHAEVFASLGIALRLWARASLEKVDTVYHAEGRPTFATVESIS
jgi:hypothetical protein